MSSVSKTSTLRLIVPSSLAARVKASLGPSGKIETRDVTLAGDRLTTERIVRLVKDYGKLREEISQTLRQLGIERDSSPVIPDFSDLTRSYSQVETSLAAARSEFQNLRSELDANERQLQEVEKQIATVEQLKATGFSSDEILSRATGFRRILGRLPAKKLEAAQKTVRSLLKDPTVMTTGAKKNDWVYMLVATPTENSSQTLQTLLLYDFVPTDMPSFEGPDLDEALKSWQAKKDELTKRKESLSVRVESLRVQRRVPLNKSADETQELLLLLRSSLRLGAGTKATHIFARLETPPPSDTLNALQRDGILELD